MSDTPPCAPALPRTTQPASPRTISLTMYIALGAGVSWRRGARERNQIAWRRVQLTSRRRVSPDNRHHDETTHGRTYHANRGD